MLRIVALGGLSVLRQGSRVAGAAAQPRRMAVLAMIARAGARGVSRDRLIAMLWPDATEDRARNALKQALYALRQDAVSGELFLGTADLRLNPDVATCDVAEFELALRAGDLERAVALYEGPFLDGFRLVSSPEFEDWVEEERRGLERSCIDALERLAALARERRDPTAAVSWARRLAGMDPLNARFATTLMHALLAAGDRNGALQHARIHESLTEQRLDLPPDREVVELAQRIREGNVPLPPSSLPAVAATARRPGDPGGRDQGTSPTTVAPRAAVTAFAPAARSAPMAPTAPSVAAPPPSSGAAGDAPSVAVPRDELSVAVLPFVSMSPGADVQHLADGLAEEIIHALDRDGGVRVPGRSATLDFGGSPAALPALALSLGVGAVLEGSVRCSGDLVRVTTRLLHAETGATLWSERYDRERCEDLAFQEDIAGSVAVHVVAALRKAAGRPGGPSPREIADDLYAHGRRNWEMRGSGLTRALELFRRAVAADPTHAKSHAALADSYSQLAFYGYVPPRRAMEMSEAALRDALRLAPDLAEAHAARGATLVGFARDYAGGLAALERAVELDPSWAASRYRLAFSRLCVDDDPEEALRQARAAAEMSGATGHARVMLGMHLIGARRIDDARRELHAAIDVEMPSFLAFHWLVVAHLLAGSPAEAVSAAVAEVSLSDRHPWAVSNLITACAAAGQHDQAATLFAGLRARAARSFVQPSVLALAHCALGECDTAIELMSSAIDSRDPSTIMLRAFPMYDPLRGHAGFPGLLRDVGLAA